MRMRMTPNYERAATAAAETLIRYNVSAAPVAPLRMLKAEPGVIVLTFAELASGLGVDRRDLLGQFGSGSKDAVTLVHDVNGVPRYFVGYNLMLPEFLLQRSIARELGHIVLGHDGSRPQDVREAEAICFAMHLLCPRPLIRAIQDAGVPITVEALGLITGCYERGVASLRRVEGVRVSPELNRQVRAQFAAYVDNVADCRALLSRNDTSPQVDFGKYLEGYEE